MSEQPQIVTVIEPTTGARISVEQETADQLGWEVDKNAKKDSTTK